MPLWGEINVLLIFESGLVFNSELQLCDWPFNVAPPCGTKKDNPGKSEWKTFIEVRQRITVLVSEHPTV